MDLFERELHYIWSNLTKVKSYFDIIIMIACQILVNIVTCDIVRISNILLTLFLKMSRDGIRKKDTDILSYSC